MQAFFQRYQKKPLGSNSPGIFLLHSLTRNSKAHFLFDSMICTEKISKAKKPNHQFKEPTQFKRNKSPSVYHQRIISEQIELPDGRICTRVPARRWRKVKIKGTRKGFVFKNKAFTYFIKKMNQRNCILII